MNLISSSHPHFKSVLIEGLWGFPDNAVNRSRWSALEPGADLLLYFEHNGVKGVWMLAKLLSVEENRKPITYWIEDPTGYPFQVRFKVIHPREHLPTPENPFKVEWLNDVKPIQRDELAHTFGISALRSRQDRWSLYVFGDTTQKGITYDISLLNSIFNEYVLRNKAAVRKVTHDELVEIVYNLGQLQGKYPYKEETIDRGKIDVVWRRLRRRDAAPYIAFEIHISGDLYADLVKLKHAYDMWNAIPVLILPEEKKEQARSWIEGSFHEIAHKFRLITIDEILDFYRKKRELKNLERQLGII